MNVKQMQDLIANGKFSAVESAWLDAMEQRAPLEEMCEVLRNMIDAGRAAEAETMATTYLAESVEQRPPAEALDIARGVALAVPDSREVRKQTVELYRAVHGEHEHFGVFLAESGLEGDQSTRRAVRTLDTCLALKPASFLVNRFDHRVLRVEAYSEVMEQFDLLGPGGARESLQPKLLADEYTPVDPDDFRVLCQFAGEQLAERIKKDPAGVLIGVCMSRGGQVDSDDLKDLLVPDHLDAKSWSGWWSRARTAAKRCEHLSLEGRSPVTIRHHPGGLSLEEELAADAENAKTPLAQMSLLQQYVREARHRGAPVDPGFAGPLLNRLAEEAEEFKTRRPADALIAALALDALPDGLPNAGMPHPTPAKVLAGAAHPAQAIAALHDNSLWPAALEALAQRQDAAEHFVELLRLAPANQLDAVAKRVGRAARADALDAAVADAVANPVENLQLLIWLWNDPKTPPAGVPAKLELLSRLLTALQEIARDLEMKSSRRKAAYQDIRSALSAKDYASYRQAVEEMDEGVAATIKRRITFNDALGPSVTDNMMEILREKHFGLWIKAKVDAWLDENVLWTTHAALHRREAELKDLMEVKMPANSRAIGEAAGHGDLSENSEWQYAIEEQRRLQAQAAQMQDELAKARVIQAEDVPTDFVGIGSSVTLRNVADGRQVTLNFLGPWDGDVQRNVFSYRSALAQSLMGKAPGETVTLKLADHEGQYAIEAIGSAFDPEQRGA